ncbi:MAG: chemotaxis protein CheX [Proteobacteria bacterium]|nr:chemotaxis protein CheX [Pseudomonadota bacterium]MBU4036890.1 chemotaxis protein CheX [Pseudomonadota bacterium]
MSGEMMTAMKQAISEVMEKMFFMPVQINDKPGTLSEWFSSEEPIIGATLSFTGIQSGYSYLLIPAGAARELTANFLGYSEDTISEKHERDTVKEALNMIVGYMLSQFEDAFKLGIPQYINESDFMAKRLEGDYNGAFSVKTYGNCIAAGLIMNMPLQ